MNRRHFIALAGGTAALACSPLRAQEARRTPLIGIAAGFSETEMKPLLEAFRAQLRGQGWTAGGNLTIEARYAGGAYEAEHAQALIDRKPDVIVTQGTGMLTVVRKLTTTIPVVFTMVPDPVQLGIVDNLARPGGNITGFTNFEFSIAGKWLEILKEIKPSLQQVLQIANPGNPNNVQFARHIERLGERFGFVITTREVRSGEEITAAIDAFARPEAAVLVLPDSLLVINRKRIIEATNRHRLPAMCPFRVFNDDGGLLSYGLNFEELYRQAAGYVVRILNGEKPGELPIQAPTKFDLIINVKTAKAIGLDISPLVLARADEVIE